MLQIWFYNLIPKARVPAKTYIKSNHSNLPHELPVAHMPDSFTQPHLKYKQPGVYVNRTYIESTIYSNTTCCMNSQTVQKHMIMVTNPMGPGGNQAIL